jgi:hypothetical protein
MNVRELIEELSNLPPDMTVVARSYEDGYDTVAGCEIIDAGYNSSEHHSWYYGRWDHHYADPEKVVNLTQTNEKR